MTLNNLEGLQQEFNSTVICWCADKYQIERNTLVIAVMLQKPLLQDGGLSELLLAYFCLTNHSEAASQ